MRARVFDDYDSMNDARTYWNNGVLLTEIVPTAEEAEALAAEAVRRWEAGNHYSNLGFLIGVLRVGEGKYRGGYQLMWSAT